MKLPVVNFRDHKAFQKENAYWIDILNEEKNPWYFRLIKFFLAPSLFLILFPFKKKMRKGIWASAYISELVKAKKFEEGYVFGIGRLSDWKIHKLEGFYGPAYYSTWWTVFQQTCRCALELPRDECLKTLLEIMQKGPEPQVGYEVSLAYCALSRLFWSKNDLEGAWQLIEKAIESDKTQGFAYYLRAWFGTYLKKGQPLSDLITATQHEPELKKSIFEDKMFKELPDLLNTLKDEMGE
jgi:hypothetical protein